MKTIILGFDAYDPVIFEKLNSEGKTPNLDRFVNSYGYSRFSVSNPPQSEVSWTSIATGLNPGGHGIFDFVHRIPSSYGRQVSLLPTKVNVLGRQFIPPHRAPTIFDTAVEDGYPGVSLWWPATFPARLASPVWSIPGLGTPDIFGRLGVGIFYSMEKHTNGDEKTRIEQLSRVHDQQFTGTIQGPVGMTLTGSRPTIVNFELRILDAQNAQLMIGKESYNLTQGEWSPIIELSFKVGFGIKIKAVTRVIMNALRPSPTLYFLPLQIHPLRSPWPYGTPKSFLKDVWNNTGGYLTLGWPQDTTGLEEGFISDDQFLTICDQIFDHRELTLMQLLENYEEGVLACIFDSLDRVQHMFLRDRKDVVEAWYMKYDALLGRVQNIVQNRPDNGDIQLIVISDHGFGEFNYKVNLNRWLLNHGYLSTNDYRENGKLNSVTWETTRTYAIGLNSIYLNLDGREGRGCVPVEKKEETIQSVRRDLLAWKGPDGKPVVNRVLTQTEVFDGPYTEYGPDILVGYTPGYRASAETGLGDWGINEIEKNEDHWGSDHCFDADAVPGVIFARHELNNISNPSFSDIPFLAIGKEIKKQTNTDIPAYSDEDQEVIEERLKELGYL
jgi:predicted AlkP superfamily phosphohydrolase/phosphomutase